MNTQTLLLFTTLFVFSIHGSESPEASPWVFTRHGADEKTLASLEKTANILKQTTENVKIQVGISTESSIRITGMGITLLATASILYSNELNPRNVATLSSGLTAMIGARKIAKYMDGPALPYLEPSLPQVADIVPAAQAVQQEEKQAE